MVVYPPRLSFPTTAACYDSDLQQEEAATVHKVAVRHEPVYERCLTHDIDPPSAEGRGVAVVLEASKFGGNITRRSAKACHLGEVPQFFVRCALEDDTKGTLAEPPNYVELAPVTEIKYCAVTQLAFGE